MRILYASERPPYPMFLGGAARCAHQLLLALATRFDVACEAIGSRDYATTPWTYPPRSEYAALDVRGVEDDGRIACIDCGYPIRIVPDFTVALERTLERFKPDILWAQLEGALPILQVGRGRGVQCLYYVHDAELDPKELRALARLGTTFVASSAFLAARTRDATGCRAHIVYPPIETSFGVHADPSGFITMINPHRVKGLDTVLEIARRMPEQPFLLLESWKLSGPLSDALLSKIAALPNVEFRRRVSDMRAIYAATKLLIVPSVWEEGFGMVAVEAQSCGIPVLASARGGLPESVGDGGRLVERYLDASAWVDAIREALQDAAAYRALQERARQHAARPEFGIASSAARFHSACESGPALSGIAARFRALFTRRRSVRGVARPLSHS
jgi:glycosyltransferase involved in cell wall biosynthesis